MASDNTPMSTCQDSAPLETASKFLTRADYESLQEAACKDDKPYWGYAIITAWNTGLKLRQIAMLKWEYIDFKTETMAVPLTGRHRCVQTLELPLISELREFLILKSKHHRKGFPGPTYVDPDMARVYMIDRHKTLSCQFGRLCKRAGLGHKSFSSFRYTLIKRLLDSGVDSYIVAGVVGVANLRRLGSYVPVTVDAKRKALHRMVLHGLGFTGIM